MKKKVFSLLLICALALNLAACGDAATTSSPESDANTASAESEDPGEADQVSDTADVAGAGDSVETDSSADADGSGNLSDDVDSAIALNGSDSNSGAAGSSDSSSQPDPGSSGMPGELDSYWNGDYFDLKGYFEDQGFEVWYMGGGDAENDDEKGMYQIFYPDANTPHHAQAEFYTYKFSSAWDNPDGTNCVVTLNSLTINFPGDPNDLIRLGKPGWAITPEIGRAEIPYLPKIAEQLKEKGNGLIRFEDIQ